MVRSEVIVRPGAVGRLRGTASMLIAAASAAAMLTAAAPAAAAAADRAVPAALRGTGGTAAVTQTMNSGPARSAGEPAVARDAEVSAVAAFSFGPPGHAVAVRSRSAWGRTEIMVGVLIICFALLAVQAARRRGG